MEKATIKKRILSQTEFQMPDLQQRYSLSYPEIKEAVDDLIKEGRIEFVSGLTYKLSRIEKMRRKTKIKEEATYIRALWECIKGGHVSTSFIQARSSMRFIDAKKAIEWMENNGFVESVNSMEKRLTITEQEFFQKFDIPRNLSLNENLDDIVEKFTNKLEARYGYDNKKNKNEDKDKESGADDEDNDQDSEDDDDEVDGHNKIGRQGMLSEVEFFVKRIDGEDDEEDDEDDDEEIMVCLDDEDDENQVCNEDDDDECDIDETYDESLRIHRKFLEERRRELLRLWQNNACTDLEVLKGCEKMPNYNADDKTFSFKMSVTYPDGTPFTIKALKYDECWYVSDCGKTIKYLSEFESSDSMIKIFDETVENRKSSIIEDSVCVAIEDAEDLYLASANLLNVVDLLIVYVLHSKSKEKTELDNLAEEILKQEDAKMIVKALEVIYKKHINVPMLQVRLHTNYIRAKRLYNTIMKLGMLETVGMQNVLSKKITMEFILALKHELDMD